MPEQQTRKENEDQWEENVWRQKHSSFVGRKEGPLPPSCKLVGQGSVPAEWQASKRASRGQAPGMDVLRSGALVGPGDGSEITRVIYENRSK